MANPLLKKLGLKAGCRALFMYPPAHLFELFGELPEGVVLVDHPEPDLGYIHGFFRDADELEMAFPMLKAHLAPAGTLWISWPKKTSKLAADLDGNIVRETGLRHGLVDVKVCAIDADWSGLKFLYRTRDRPART
ncbi:MAG: hypothetical protein R2834_21820 [Rhodothermales bacterium]